VSHSPRIKLAGPDNFDGDRSKGRPFLTSCELYLSLTGPDYPDKQSRIHWALSFFKSGRAATFSERIVRQEMRTGVIAFADWTNFTSEFMSTFCPENEATSALMRLELDRYFQGQRNVEAYIDEFRDLVDMSSYTNPIAIVFSPRPECDDARQNCRVGDRQTTGQRPPRLVCGQTGHTSRDCDLHHDVRHMTLDEQDEFIQHIMANRDAEMAAVAELMTSAYTSEGTVVEREVDEADFVRSSE
jgi:hypothetical protein